MDWRVAVIVVAVVSKVVVGHVPLKRQRVRLEGSGLLALLHRLAGFDRSLKSSSIHCRQGGALENTNGRDGGLGLRCCDRLPCPGHPTSTWRKLDGAHEGTARRPGEVGLSRRTKMMLVQSGVRHRLFVGLIATVDGVRITITTCAVVQVVQVRLTIVVVVGGQEGRVGVTAHVGGIGQGRKGVSVGACLVLGRELSLLPARIALDIQECRLRDLVLMLMAVLLMMMTTTATGSDEHIVLLVSKVVVSTGFVFFIIVLFIFFVMDAMTDLDRRRPHHLDIL